MAPSRLPIFGRKATIPALGTVSTRGKTRWVTLERGLPAGRPTSTALEVGLPDGICALQAPLQHLRVLLLIRSHAELIPFWRRKLLHGCGCACSDRGRRSASAALFPLPAPEVLARSPESSPELRPSRRRPKFVISSDRGSRRQNESHFYVLHRMKSAIGRTEQPSSASRAAR